MELPFEEEHIKGNEFIRVFKHEIDSVDFMWHLDKEDRIISPIGETNWRIQLDNELPKLIKEKIYIPKGVYHRLIKGNGDLKIKLIKL